MLYGMSRRFLLLLPLVLAGCGWMSEGPSSATDSNAAGNDTGTAVADANTAEADALSADGASGYTFPPPNFDDRQPSDDDPFYMLGEELPEWDLEGWADQGMEPISMQSLRGRVVVVRFWTDATEANVRTMTAMQRLSEEFRNEPVDFVGIFYTPLTFGDHWERAQANAHDWGVTFPIAEDRRTLNRWWLSRYDHLPKTPTFVVGPEGQVRHLHPGPGLFPSDDQAEKLCDDDYRALRAAIVSALGRQLADTSSDS